MLDWDNLIFEIQPEQIIADGSRFILRLVDTPQVSVSMARHVLYKIPITLFLIGKANIFWITPGDLSWITSHR